MPYWTRAHMTCSMDAWLCAQIHDSRTITTSSCDTLSHELHLTGTRITTYSEIWFPESKLVNVQQCSVYTHWQETEDQGLPKRATELLKETEIFNIWKEIQSKELNQEQTKGNCQISTVDMRSWICRGLIWTNTFCKFYKFNHKH